MNLIRLLLCAAIAFIMSNTASVSCEQAVNFEDTADFKLFNELADRANNEVEFLEKLSLSGEFGKKFSDFVKFNSDSERATDDDGKILIEAWRNGDGFIVQHLVLFFSKIDSEELIRLDAIPVLEEFIRLNKEYCWIDENIFYVKGLEIYFEIAKKYPDNLSSGAFLTLMREALLDSFNSVFLNEYLRVLRSKNVIFLRDEVKKLSRVIDFTDSCKVIDQCYEMIESSVRNYLARNASRVEKMERKFRCEIIYVPELGRKIKYNLCS